MALRNNSVSRKKFIAVIAVIVMTVFFASNNRRFKTGIK